MGKKCQHFTEYQQKDLLNLFQKSEDFFPGTLGRCKTPTVYFLIFYTYNCIILYWSYILYPQGGAGVPCPLLFSVVDPSCDIYGLVWTSRCLMVLSCGSLCWFMPSTLVWIRYWNVVVAYLSLGISWRAYPKRLIPEPSSHCGRWMLIFCVGTLDPQMYRCVTRTKVMLTLLLTYPHVLE